MTYVPKEPDEAVNVTPVHPLVNFAYLLGTVLVVAIAAYISLGFIADVLVTRISPELEVKIGRRLVPEEVWNRADSVPSDLSFLRNLVADMRDVEVNERVPLSIYLIDEGEPNAGVFPGGHIVVARSLLEAAESENEVAFVMAHELGHFEARDALQGLGRSLVFLTVASALGLHTGNSPSAVSLSGQLATLHHSRRQELAADRFALAAVVERYGHGGHSLGFFENLLESDYDTRSFDYFSTHPLTQDRINALHRYAERQGWSMDGEPTPLSFPNRSNR